MKGLKKILSSKITTAVMFLLAAALLLSSGFTGARAALSYYSDVYSSEVELYDIGVTLLENGEPVSYRNYVNRDWDEESGALLKTLTNTDGSEADAFHPGVIYKEEISVRNSGTIGEFVRVTLCTYWLDKNGDKLTTLSPELIKLELDDTGAWYEDQSAKTSERRVFYYLDQLNSGEESSLLTKTLSVDSMIASKVTQVVEGNTIYTTYDYDGVTFCMEAEVDAVQDHNAEAAALSAWGKNVSVSGEGDSKTLTIGD